MAIVGFTFHNQSARGFRNEFEQACSIVLAIEQARKFYPRVFLTTDSYGYALLVDALGLEFEAVNLVLDDKRFVTFNIPKFFGYKALNDTGEAWIHLDYDAYLFSELPKSFLAMDVGVQSYEPPGIVGATPFAYVDMYRRVIDERKIPHISDLWKNDTRPYNQRGGLNCGILHFTDNALADDYINEAMAMAFHPQNSKIPRDLGIMIEQALLETILHQRGIPYGNLLETDRGKEVKFTHLLGETKKNPQNIQKVINRVKNDYPNFYAKISNYYK